MTEYHPDKFIDKDTTTTYCVAKGDTGASHHYWTNNNKSILKNLTKMKGISVQLPNSEIITSTEKGELPLSSLLSPQAKNAIVLPKLTSANLISLGQLCDDGCSIVLDKNKMIAVKDNTIVLKGKRNKKDGLWDIPITKTSITTNCCAPTKTHAGLYSDRSVISATTRKNNQHKVTKGNLPQHLQQLSNLALENDFYNAIHQQERIDSKHKLNVILRKKQTHMELVNYLHAACFSPVKSTFVKAIKNGFLKSWPGLTAPLVEKYLTESVATAQGHLKQEKQHLQSTKKLLQNKHPIDELCKQTRELHLNDKSNDAVINNLATQPEDCEEVTYMLIDRKNDKIGYIDSTGRFPQRSSSGNEYIFIGYHYAGNTILATALKNRTAQSLVNAWKDMHKTFTKTNNAPKIYVLDNEKSTEILNAFKENNVLYQLVPPHSHRTNMAERAIQTFKDHFKAGLATCDPNFPLSEWDRLLPQAVITLNLLRPARARPNISAYAYIFQDFDFQSTPLAPPGTKVIAHVKPSNRNSWDLNGTAGYYVGPALQHYRCVTCYFPRTRSERVCDTVRFIPNIIPLPQTNIDSYLRQAASDIVSILTKPPSTTYPSLSAGDPVRNALLELATQLGRAEPIGTETSTPQLHKSTSSNVIEEEATPRVQHGNQPPRVLERTRTPSHTQVAALDPINNSIKNNRFQNTLEHRYPLRSKTKQALTIQEIDPHSLQFINHIYTPEGTRLSIDALLNSSDNKIWQKSLSNEWGRLADGNIYGIKGTKTITFISKHAVPRDRDVTYATYVCDIKPLKAETHRVRITVGGDRLSCPDDTGSPAANMLETKLLVNSTISDSKYGAKFLSADIVNYFLASPMKRSEYMKVRLKHLPKDIIDKYNINSIATSDGFVYVRIDKGMYGLKNAAILAYDNLKANLAKHGYFPVPGTSGLWTHKTRRTRFCVCVDDFGVKYFTIDDIKHLLHAIGCYYKYTVDWSGNHYCGLTLQWNYDAQYVDVSMPSYIPKALARFNHTPTKFPQLSPHEHVPITYTKRGEQQFAPTPDPTSHLSPKDRRTLQSIVGTMLYYARAIDYTILPALNDIAREQSNPTVRTMNRAKRVLDYAATYPSAFIRYHSSSMILHVDSDAAYLIAPQAKSRVAGFYYLSSHPSINNPPPSNGGIHVECKILRHVVASAAEAEIAGVFHNAQTVLPIRRILRALNHPQPPTPVKTDNTTTNGFIYNNIHQKRSKSWDMRYYWLRDKITQQQLKFFWESGQSNKADYFTKHHSTKHHRATRQQYVYDKTPVPTKYTMLANHISSLYLKLQCKCTKND